MFDQPHVVGERYRELERMRALELAIERTDAHACFSRSVPRRSNRRIDCFRASSNCRALLPGGWELGITISLPTDVDILRITEVYREARDHELLVAFDEFQGNGGQVMHLESLLPDYLVLAANMTKDLTSTRQPLRRLESLLAACEELVIKPVLPRNDSGHAVALCQEIGFDLVLQAAPRDAAPAPNHARDGLVAFCCYASAIVTYVDRHSKPATSCCPATR